jgi:hypothetical protein
MQATELSEITEKSVLSSPSPQSVNHDKEACRAGRAVAKREPVPEIRETTTQGRNGAKSHRSAAALFPLFVFLCAPASWRFRCFGFVARARDAADAARAVLEMFTNPKRSFEKRVRAKPTVPAHIHESPGKVDGLRLRHALRVLL